jgi:hypothetical protein
MSYYDEGGNMGYYIKTNGVKNKAEFIVKNYGGIRVTRPSSFNQIAPDEALILRIFFSILLSPLWLPAYLVIQMASFALEGKCALPWPQLHKDIQ